MANSNKEWNSITMSAGSSEGSASSLMDLLDVSVLNPTDGQTLVYSAEEGKWVNHDSGGGGSTVEDFVVNCTIDYGTKTPTIDKTFAEISAAISDNKHVYLLIGDAFTNSHIIVPVTVYGDSLVTFYWAEYRNGQAWFYRLTIEDEDNYTEFYSGYINLTSE